MQRIPNHMQEKKKFVLLAHDWIVEVSRTSPHLLRSGATALYRVKLRLQSSQSICL